jgi:hypothetical protein
MGERGREMEEDEATLKHGNTMSKKIHPLTKIWRQLQWEDGFFCAVIRTHLHTWALYVSTITSITSPYVCTCWHVSNPRKWHDIDGAENGEKWNVAKCRANIFQHVADMSSDMSMLHQNCRRWHPTNPTKITRTCNGPLRHNNQVWVVHASTLVSFLVAVLVWCTCGWVKNSENKAKFRVFSGWPILIF